MRRALCLAVPVALAGCFGGDESETPEPTQTVEPTSEPTTDPTPEPTPEPIPENRPPTATLSASTEGGPLPLLVNFTFDASDPDGDELEWAFDADDDGEIEAEGFGDELPGAFSFEYTAVGVYEATFYFTDGDFVEWVTVDIDVTEATSASVIFAGSLVAPDAAGAASNECVYALFEAADILPDTDGLGDYHPFDGATYDGWSVTLDPADGLRVQFVAGTSYAGDHNPVAVPGGATGVLVCSDTAVNTDYAVTLTS